MKLTKMELRLAQDLRLEAWEHGEPCPFCEHEQAYCENGTAGCTNALKGR